MAEEPAQAVDCLKRVLAVDPDNEQARERLEKYLAEPEKLKPKKNLFLSSIVLIALLIVGCSFCAFGLLMFNAVYMLYIIPNERSNRNATEVAQALVSPTLLISSDTPAPTGTATAESSSTPTETQTKIPTVTLITAKPVNASSAQQPVSGLSGCVPRNNQVEAGIVTRVIDGDTIEAFVNGQTVTIRYIGIDTPETVHPGEAVQYFGPEASEKNKQLVEGKNVILVKDVSETDQYNRLLRYVLVGDLYGQFVNYELVRQGVRERFNVPAGCGLRRGFPGCSTPGCGGGGGAVEGDADSHGNAVRDGPAAVEERKGKLRSIISNGVHSAIAAGFGLQRCDVQKFQGAAAGSTSF